MLSVTAARLPSEASSNKCVCVQAFVADVLGPRFVDPPPLDLPASFRESSPAVPLIFVLSSGADPMADLLKLAEETKFAKKFEKVWSGMQLEWCT